MCAFLLKYSKLFSKGVIRLDNNSEWQTPPPVQRQPVFINGSLDRSILKGESKAFFRQNYGTILAASILPALISTGIDVIPFIGPVISWFLSPILFVGGYYVILGVIRNHRVSVGNMFDIFDNFGNVFGASFTTSLLLFLWSVPLSVAAGAILAVAGLDFRFTKIPGINIPIPTGVGLLFLLVVTFICCIPAIYKAFCWAMVPYILADNPRMTGTQARRLSTDMMQGHKWEYFVLSLSFLGWFILSIITIGLFALFYVNPWYSTALCDYYDNLRMLYAAMHQQQNENF
ncbi:MAG: DUF975 family protein [Lachnospiraceae bacterium]|nr:MAG: DUF975 family protein [Lachnospiraceae bacterium]